MIEIGDDVGVVLDADAEADRLRTHAGADLLVRGHLPMGGRSGMAAQRARVAWVDYVGFADSPYHALARKYLDGRAPSLLTFGVKGDIDNAKAFHDALKLVKRLVNIGDTRSLCCHPASTTHRQMTPEQQLKAGVRPQTIRLSIGIEHVEDILADIDQALRAAAPAARSIAAE